MATGEFGIPILSSVELGFSFFFAFPSVYSPALLVHPVKPDCREATYRNIDKYRGPVDPKGDRREQDKSMTLFKRLVSQQQSNASIY
jgi:hypothetical protein